MGVTHNKQGYPAVAASVTNEGMAVAFASGGAAFGVHPATMLALGRLAGIAESTAGTVGQSIHVITGGITKAWAAGSIANGDLVTPGSVNGALVAFIASPATAGNPQRYFVGRALQNAGPGDKFSVLVDPGTSL